ncbi:hypothetical protein [Amycolatopsis magusensis]|uniref:TAT (Twin-arginine translocation) pathway signal sequence n=1 Tax=Amycolatopsis magusensis TaxID=882444 RepID=A0ABS4PTI4_9PSEU|nr:hypothetical protein [Amycolatopsis magusensis]MBP2182746.1 hypothetical protein [Amycolatopsis magusensis]
MTMPRPFSRRLFLGSAAAFTGLAGFAGFAAVPTAVAAGGWSGPVSANGWPILTRAGVFAIEGSNHTVALAEGDAATILAHVARRFHYEIDSLRDGDLVGFAPDRPVTQPYESNYLSGTAIAIRTVCYPLGARGGLYPWEETVVRDILAELGGAVSWGGDEQTPMESHFQLACAPGHPVLQAAAQRIRGGQATLGAIDAFAPDRLEAAQKYRLHGPTS